MCGCGCVCVCISPQTQTGSSVEGKDGSIATSLKCDKVFFTSLAAIIIGVSQIGRQLYQKAFPFILCNIRLATMHTHTHTHDTFIEFCMLY